MKAAPLSRRDRLRQILADLRVPGALEALDAILRDVDGGALTASDAIEQLMTAQIQLRNNRRLQAAMRSKVGCRPSSSSTTSTSRFSPRCDGIRSRACTNSAS